MSPRERTEQPVQDIDELLCLHTHAWVSHLRDENDELPKMRGMFVRIDLKYLARGVVMVPLLQKLFFVRDRVALDEILKLWEVRRAPESAYHSGSGSLESKPRAGFVQFSHPLALPFVLPLHDRMNGSTGCRVFSIFSFISYTQKIYERAALFFLERIRCLPAMMVSTISFSLHFSSVVAVHSFR